MEFMKNTAVAKIISAAPVYQKSAKTFLRRPRPEEIGTQMTTYVKHGDSVRKESQTQIGDNILARNEGVIGKDEKGQNIYNEWPIPLQTAIKNYGEQVIASLSTDEYTPHKKIATLQATELTPEIMNLLGAQGQVLEITVSWSPEPMIAHEGDYLASGGYSISKQDMKDYELV